jgi:hypothetical protein
VNDEEWEETALKDLWDAIDGLLGPGARQLEGYDTGTIDHETMRQLAKAVDGNKRDTRHTQGESIPIAFGVEQDSAWWKAFRQGLLMS